jgi:hypothetical protein
MKYGARHLKRAIERHVVYPLASLLATEQVSLGDVLSIDWDAIQNNLIFVKEADGALVPTNPPLPEVMREAAAASSDGRTTFFPAATAAADAAATQKTIPAATRSLPVEKSRNEKK